MSCTGSRLRLPHDRFHINGFPRWTINFQPGANIGDCIGQPFEISLKIHKRRTRFIGEYRESMLISKELIFKMGINGEGSVGLPLIFDGMWDHSRRSAGRFIAFALIMQMDN